IAREHVDERSEGPLDRPWDVQRADEGADRRGLEPLAAHLRGERASRKAAGNPLGQIEQEECGEAAPASREEVGKSHARTTWGPRLPKSSRRSPRGCIP